MPLCGIKWRWRRGDLFGHPAIVVYRVTRPLSSYYSTTADDFAENEPKKKNSNKSGRGVGAFQDGLEIDTRKGGVGRKSEVRKTGQSRASCDDDQRRVVLPSVC